MTTQIKNNIISRYKNSRIKTLTTRKSRAQNSKKMWRNGDLNPGPSAIITKMQSRCDNPYTISPGPNNESLIATYVGGPSPLLTGIIRWRRMAQVADGAPPLELVCFVFLRNLQHLVCQSQPAAQPVNLHDPLVLASLHFLH